jgi:hypothetical protein
MDSMIANAVPTLNGIYNGGIFATVNCAGAGTMLACNRVRFTSFRGSTGNAAAASHSADHTISATCLSRSTPRWGAVLTALPTALDATGLIVSGRRS